MALCAFLIFPYQMKAQNTSTSDHLYLLVGTYSSETAPGISVYDFNPETGEMLYVSDTKGLSNPSFLTVSADERFVYAVNENKGDNAAAQSFAFDKKAGTLTPLNKQPAHGADPCYISTDRKARFVVTANYSGGTLTVFPLNADGTLKPSSQQFEYPSDKASHIHSAVFSPDDKYLFVADLGKDKLFKYEVNPEKGSDQFLLKGKPEAYIVQPGSGPRHFTFHPTGKFAYLLNEISGTVTAYEYENGNLKEIQYIASDTSDRNRKSCADIHVSPDGRFLYTSNRSSHNGISIFKIDERSGVLSYVGHQPTGRVPRNFTISPNGKWLLAASHGNDNMIQLFAIDPVSGLLTENPDRKVQINQPVCLVFARR